MPHWGSASNKWRLKEARHQQLSMMSGSDERRIQSWVITIFLPLREPRWQRWVSEVHGSMSIVVPKYSPAIYSARSKEEKQLAAYCKRKNALVSDGLYIRRRSFSGRNITKQASTLNLPKIFPQLRDLGVGRGK